MKKCWIILYILVATSLIYAQASKNVSLIVKYYPNDKISFSKVRVVKYDFIDGNFISEKVLFTANTDKVEKIIQLYQSRYILIINQTIFDDYEWKPKDVLVYDLKFGKFVYNQKIFTLNNRKITNFELTSPDGKKIIELEMKRNSISKLPIKIEGKETLVINETFTATVASKSSIIPFVPILWIDNDLILTQKENGKLVIITLDGKVNPFLELPCNSEDFPRLRKTKAGKIIYICSGDEYKIDVEKNSFEKIRKDLDYDFSDDYKNYFYNDKEIGKSGFGTFTTEGYLAATYGKPTRIIGSTTFTDANNINIVKIWNKYTEQWKLFKVNGSNIEILGWYENY